MLANGTDIAIKNGTVKCFILSSNPENPGDIDLKVLPLLKVIQVKIPVYSSLFRLVQGDEDEARGQYRLVVPSSLPPQELEILADILENSKDFIVSYSTTPD